MAGDRYPLGRRGDGRAGGEVGMGVGGEDFLSLGLQPPRLQALACSRPRSAAADLVSGATRRLEVDERAEGG